MFVVYEVLLHDIYIFTVVNKQSSELHLLSHFHQVTVHLSHLNLKEKYMIRSQGVYKLSCKAVHRNQNYNEGRHTNNSLSITYVPTRHL